MESQKIVELGVRRKPGYLYYLNAELDVCCTPANPKQVKNAETRVVAKTDLAGREKGYLYYLDKDGDISRALMSR